MKVSISTENIEIVTCLEINELQEKNSNGAGGNRNRLKVSIFLIKTAILDIPLDFRQLFCYDILSKIRVSIYGIEIWQNLKYHRVKKSEEIGLS